MEIRPLTMDELPALGRLDALVFAEDFDPEANESWREVFEPERSLGAFDDAGQLVATAGAFSFDLTVPGGRALPVAGVSYVGVLPTHRRRGVLRTLMARQLDDVQARGEAMAVLLASQSVIYGRFGYGLASSSTRAVIDRAGAAFLPSVRLGGRVRLLEADDAAKVLPEVYERARGQQPGMTGRSAAWWRLLMRDPERGRQGATAFRYAVWESDEGRPEGYTTYRVRQGDWKHNLADGRVEVHELVTASMTARANLWRFLLDIDLMASVTSMNLPVDEPLRWLLADPRQLKVTQLTDFLWARVVDVGAALSARTYAAEGSVVFEVDDAFRPEGSGRFVLEAAADGTASCQRTQGPPELVLGVAELGATYLGGTSFHALAQAGRVQERAPGGLRRADALFACHPAPWCANEF